MYPVKYPDLTSSKKLLQKKIENQTNNDSKQFQLTTIGKAGEQILGQMKPNMMKSFHQTSGFNSRH